MALLGDGRTNVCVCLTEAAFPNSFRQVGEVG